MRKGECPLTKFHKVFGILSKNTFLLYATAAGGDDETMSFGYKWEAQV